MRRQDALPDAIGEARPQDTDQAISRVRDWLLQVGQYLCGSLGIADDLANDRNSFCCVCLTAGQKENVGEDYQTGGGILGSQLQMPSSLSCLSGNETASALSLL